MKGVISAAFLILFLSLSASAQDKCKPVTEYTVKETAQGKYTIALQSQSSLDNPTFELVDMATGKVVATRKLPSLRARQDVFLNVRPSVYYIHIKQEGCARSKGIGGVEGIKVGNVQ